MRNRLSVLIVASVLLSSPASVYASDQIGQVTGIGGVFVVSRDPKALSSWYRDVLGVSLQPWGGAIFRYGSARRPPLAIWTAFRGSASEFKHSNRDFMINFTVDNLDAFVARLHEKHVHLLERDSDAFGRFATFLDPDGTKIELWQPTQPKQRRP